jgi:hypothetical protein
MHVMFSILETTPFYEQLKLQKYFNKKPIQQKLNLSATCYWIFPFNLQWCWGKKDVRGLMFPHNWSSGFKSSAVLLSSGFKDHQVSKKHTIFIVQGSGVLGFNKPTHSEDQNPGRVIRTPLFPKGISQSLDRGPDSSVGIATRYELEGPGIESRLERDFPHPPRRALGPTQPPIQWIPGLSRG